MAIDAKNLLNHHYCRVATGFARRGYVGINFEIGGWNLNPFSGDRSGHDGEFRRSLSGSVPRPRPRQGIGLIQPARYSGAQIVAVQDQ